MHTVTLNDLTHVHKFTQQVGRAWRWGTQGIIPCFSCCQMVADRANTANAWCDLLHLEQHASFTEFFKTSEFVHMEIGMLNCTILFEVNGDFRMSFNAGYGFNCNFLCNHIYS